ncbi:MAG: cell surface protein [Bergeyella zoohelcum]|nr:cell surface protein [Bergeyella zoohelcum]
MTFKQYSLLIISAISLVACTLDKTEDTPNTELQNEYFANRRKIIPIIVSDNPTTDWEWVLSKKNSAEDSIRFSAKEYYFISPYAGKFTLKVKGNQDGNLIDKTLIINIYKEPQPYSKYISKVYDFSPAVGQFINKLPLWETGDTNTQMIQKASAIVGENPSLISLGGFGGYVVFGFDHTIIRRDNHQEIKILGNTFSGGSEPGIVLVAFDKNRNGLPDDEWYEIAGSEYQQPQTIKNYTITYHKPNENKTAVKGSLPWQTDVEYIKWEDNQGQTGYKTKNAYHLQSYYPLWITNEKISFTGTKLANNYTNTGTEDAPYWQGKSYSYGYVDNAPNNDSASNIDIDWAVDKNGNAVKLPGIDFVKVYTATNQEAGWLGEISTEVVGAYEIEN